MMKISDAELKVMDVIWERKEITSGEIIKELDNSNWSSNTIRTLIRRLKDKKMIKVIKLEGKTQIFKPSISQEEYRNKITKDFLEQLFDDSIIDFLTLIAKDNTFKKEIKQFLEDKS